MDVQTSKRHRSPSYPSIPLPAAIERARTLYQHERRSAANVVVALKHWGYGPVSGRGRMLLAAMLTFGLVKDSGSKNSRQVQLTELALRIVLDERPDSEERAEAIRQAALMPKIYREIVSKWPGLEVSDANLRHYLLFERRFNENAIPDFIKDLRETISFASVTSAPDNGAQDEEIEQDDEVATPAPVLATTASKPGPAQPANSAYRPQVPAPVPAGKVPGMRQEVFALAEGDVTIQWPERLSPDSLEDFTDWLRILERKIKRNALAPIPATNVKSDDAKKTDEDDEL